MKKAIKSIAVLLTVLIALSGCGIVGNICSHTDHDDNGVCDKCSVSVLVTIDFYAINDLHGKFKDTDSNEGVDELTTYLRRRYQEDDNVILLSSGDMWQGSSESNLTKGLLITDWMNELDFASMTLGNHEFDWGEEFVEENDDTAEFPLLAINVFDRNTGERADYCDASVVVERGGLQIGIIGAIGDCYSSISADKTEGFYIVTDSMLTDLVKAEAERLRESGVDYIVYSIHDGYDQNTSNKKPVTDDDIGYYYDTSLSNGYVDLVFEGHTHKKYVLVDEYNVYHLQNGGENKGISHVEIKINAITGAAVTGTAQFIAASTYTRLPDDKIVDDLLEKYKDDISAADVVLGNLSSKLRSDDIKELVARLYYEFGVKTWGDEYDIVLGGGYISTRNPHSLSAGQVKYADIQAILPFDNNLTLCSIKGRDLKSRFFENENSNYYIYYGDYGEDVRYNIDPDKTYYIVADTYSSTYGPNNLTEIERIDEEFFARDLLAEYIKNGGLKK